GSRAVVAAPGPRVGRRCRRRGSAIRSRAAERGTTVPTDSAMTRILVIEDHADLAFGLQTALENEGFDVEVAGDGSSGLDRGWTGGCDLILLDLMLPKLDGYRVLRALRTDGSEGPILVLTARGEEANKVQ